MLSWAWTSFQLSMKKNQLIIITLGPDDKHINVFLKPVFGIDLHMSLSMWFPTIRHFDKCRLIRACAASF